MEIPLEYETLGYELYFKVSTESTSSASMYLIPNFIELHFFSTISCLVMASENLKLTLQQYPFSAHVIVSAN